MNKSATKAIRHFVNKTTTVEKPISEKRVKKRYLQTPHNMRAIVKAYMLKV